jgi:hypothetical protein
MTATDAEALAEHATRFIPTWEDDKRGHQLTLERLNAVAKADRDEAWARDVKTATDAISTIDDAIAAARKAEANAKAGRAPADPDKLATEADKIIADADKAREAEAEAERKAATPASS